MFESNFQNSDQKNVQFLTTYPTAQWTFREPDLPLSAINTLSRAGQNSNRKWESKNGYFFLNVISKKEELKIKL